MRYFIGFLILMALGIGLYLFIESGVKIELRLPAEVLLQINQSQDIDSDIENQKPLADPPPAVKGVYATSWTAGSDKQIDYLINFIKKNNLNAIVIDIKDFSGYVTYDIKNPEVEKYGAKEIRIPKINALIKKLHDEKIYAIARITIFQDPVLAKARPDLAIHSRRKLTTIWLDHKGLAWIDPTAKEAWDYNIAIAKDAINRGFDEINFDYIRFASDGNLDDMAFPLWDEKTPKREIIREFFRYLRKELADVKISADLFGLVTIETGDLGIGQVIEDAYEYFDFVSPMVYPSHYAAGMLGYKNPAAHPYEIIKYSLEHALNRLKIYDLGFKNNSSTSITEVTSSLKSEFLNLKSSVKLRPWLQDFDLGADYDAEMVKKEIQAVYDAASDAPELINGFMLWNPSNIYTSVEL